MTREEWLGLLSLAAIEQGKEITPTVLEDGERVYNHLAELMAAGLTWRTAVELYADSLQRTLCGDPSLPLRTAEEAVELLESIEHLDGDEAERERQELRDLIESCLCIAHDIAAIGLKARGKD